VPKRADVLQPVKLSFQYISNVSLVMKAFSKCIFEYVRYILP